MTSKIETIAKHRTVLTDSEHALVALLGTCWRAYTDLPGIPPAWLDDNAAFLRAIQEAQRVVMARAAKREFNAIYGNASGGLK